MRRGLVIAISVVMILSVAAPPAGAIAGDQQERSISSDLSGQPASASIAGSSSPPADHDTETQSEQKGQTTTEDGSESDSPAPPRTPVNDSTRAAFVSENLSFDPYPTPIMNTSNLSSSAESGGESDLTTVIYDGSKTVRRPAASNRSNVSALTGAVSANGVAEANLTNDSPQSTGLSPEAIIGPDDRVQLTDTTSSPFSQIVRVNIVTASNTAGSCTGFIINEEDPNEPSSHVVTAGHCVVEGGEFIDITRPAIDGDSASFVTPGRNGATRPFGAVGIERVRTYSAFIDNNDRAYDIALLTLEDQVGGQTGSFGIAGEPVSSATYNNEVEVVGYPGDKPPGTMWGAVDTGRGTSQVISGQAPVHLYDTDTASGQSGAPAGEYAGTGTNSVVSVHVAALDRDGDGSAEVNVGAPLTPDRLSDIRTWMERDDIGTSAGNDRFEPNDGQADATRIGGDDVLTNLQIDNGERDVFAVELQQGDALRATANFEHNRGDLDMQVTGPAGGIDASTSVSDNERVRVPTVQSASAAGTYYVTVYGFSGASAPYSLSVSVDRASGVRSPGSTSNGSLQVTARQTSRANFPTIEVFSTVNTASGDPVNGLDSSDFTITEEGTQQSVTSVQTVNATNQQRVSVALAIDRSGSIGPAIDTVEQAAQNFVSLLGPNDEATVLSFADDTRVDQRFTRDRSQIQAAIDFQAGGNTELYGTTIESVNQVSQRSGRSAVIILTDGRPTTDSASLSDAISTARQQNVPVYTIGLGGGVNDQALRQLASETGGEYFAAPSSSELQQIYEQISQQINNEYRITYETQNRTTDGAIRDVEIDVTNGSQQGTATTQYEAPCAPLPTATFTQSVNGQRVSFDASGSSANGGQLVNYQWDFTNDGQVDATGVQVTHQYNSTGTFEARLIVQKGCGVTDTTRRSVTVDAGSGPGQSDVELTSSVQATGQPGDQATVEYTITNASGQSGLLVNLNDTPTQVSVDPAASSYGGGSVNPSGVEVTYFQPSDTVTATIAYDIAASARADASFNVSARVQNNSGVLDTTTAEIGNVQQGLDRFDRNGDGAIGGTEVLDAIAAFENGQIGGTDVLQVIEAFEQGTLPSQV